MPKSILARSERYQRLALYGVTSLLSVAILLAAGLFGLGAFNQFQEQQVSRFVQYREQVKSETDQLSARLMQFVDLYEGIWGLHDHDSIPLNDILEALRKGNGHIVSDNRLTSTPFSILTSLATTSDGKVDTAQLARQLRIVRDLSAVPAIDTRKLGINLSGYLYSRDYRFIASAPPTTQNEVAENGSVADAVKRQTAGIEGILAPYSAAQLHRLRPFWTSQSDFGGPDTISRIILPMLRDEQRVATMVVTVPEDQFFRVFMKNERIPGFFLLDNASHVALGYDPAYQADRRLFDVVSGDSELLSKAGARLQTFRKGGTFFITQKIEGPGWIAILAFDWRDILGELETAYSAGVVLCLAVLAALWGSVIYFEYRVARPLRLSATRLMEVKQFNRTIIDTLPIGIAVYDPAARRVLLENTVAASLLSNDARRDHAAFYHSVSVGVDSEHGEHGDNEPDGAFTETSLALDAYRSSRLGVVSSKTRWSGRDVVLIGLVDMNERIAIEQQLKMAVAEAERANRAKSMFLGLMSHEIRTPLHGAIGHLELLSHADLGAEQQARVTLVNRSVDALLTLVNDLLDMTKIEVGAFKLHLKPVLLSKVIDRSAQNFSAAIGAKGVDLWCASDPALDCLVLADEQRLTQILQNLLGNACKFTERGVIALRGVCVARGEHHIKVRLSVEDTGIGIPEEQQARIFKPLTQAHDSISQQYGGTGLGLYLCRDLTSLMGGDISIESTPGQGSSFHVDIQFALAPAQNPGNAPLASHSVELICPVAAWDAMLIARITAWGGHLYQPDQAPQRGPDIRLVAASNAHDLSWAGDANVPASANIHLSPGGPLLPLPQPSSVSAHEGFVIRTTSLSGSALVSALTKCVHHINGVNAVAGIDDGNRVSDAAPAPSDSTASSDLDVIVAEDNPISLSLITQQLRQLGITRVRTAINGHEAIALWRQAPADLLITDWQMPECDGLRVLHEIRQQDPAAKIVATTALTHGDLVTGEQDFNEILYKPIRLQDLQNMLHHVCGEIPDTSDETDRYKGDKGDKGSHEHPQRHERIDPQLLAMFVQSWAQERKTLEDIFAQRDPQRLRRRLHRLQGGLLAIGLNQLAAVNLQLQASVETMPWDALEQPYRQLLQQLDAMVAQAN